MPCLVHTATLAAWPKVNPPIPVFLDNDLGSVLRLFFNALKSLAAVILALVTACSALL